MEKLTVGIYLVGNSFVANVHKRHVFPTAPSPITQVFRLFRGIEVPMVEIFQIVSIFLHLLNQKSVS